MARLLNARYSAARLLGIVRRHIRLLKQVFNDTELTQQIQPKSDAVKEKEALVAQKEAAREDAYDDLVLADNIADDFVRTLFGRCQEFDRGNPGNTVLAKVFPDEKYGSIIRLPFASEAMEMEGIALRIEALGAEHALYPLAAEVREKAQAVKDAIAGNAAAIREVKLAEADEEIAKTELVRQYEVNYLDARKKYGKTLAERVFPKLNTNTGVREEDEEAGEESSAA